MKHTTRYVELLRDMGQAVPELREDFSHMISSALFNGMFEVVAHDLPKEDAATYIKQLQAFFNAGWDRILGLSGSRAAQLKRLHFAEWLAITT